MGTKALVLMVFGWLTGVATEEWMMTTAAQRAITGSCVVIPCTFNFPSRPYKAMQAAWFKYWYYWKYTVAYSKDPNYKMSTFVGRTDIIGDLEQKNCTLKINNLRPGDSDNYYFYVDLEGFEDHTFKEPVHLQVLDAPDRPEMLLSEDLQEGTLAYIICKALHTCPDNRPNLTWSQLLSSSASVITESKGEASTVLTFNPSHRHHGQTVRCTSHYPQTNHQVSNSVTLSVKYTPQNTSVSMTTGKGKTVSLNCSSDGNPAVHIFNWFKISQGNVTDLKLLGQTITVPYGLEVEVSYYCVATNSVGSSQSLPVQIPTEYTPRNTSVSMTTGKGKTVSLNCSSDGNPAVHRFNWFKISQGNVTDLKLSGQTIIVPYGFMELSYYCVATNSVGSSQSVPVQIPTEYSPCNLSITSFNVIKNSSISIIEGNSTVIICSVESFPESNLTWQHLNVILNRTSFNNELWLEIPHVTHRETGDYHCVAENEHGIVEKSITITVESGDSGEWKTGFIGAGIILIIGLSGFFIFVCVGRRAGRGKSAQSEHVGRYTSGEQSDKSKEIRERKQETKVKQCTSKNRGPIYENCELDWALRSQKKRKFGEIESNHYSNAHREDDIYTNCTFDKEAVYGNV
ncbi:myelin-associated glycoprotein-like [Stegostoma tigrinum]|uniref:myelin-associated glycoprotein-like n=1 Tax=Stegostoma tigrinum TaxID=3053191 RepID=UPI00287020F5|nr:myelin-associated glycoprotein-like [Stegostoma tigrinum]